MKPPLKIKDWLKEKSEKQFEFLFKDKDFVKRIKDKQYFVVGDKLKFTGKSKESLNSSYCVIDCFDEDEIHVYVRTEEVFLKEYISCIPINHLVTTWQSIPINANLFQ